MNKYAKIRVFFLLGGLNGDDENGHIRCVTFATGDVYRLTQILALFHRHSHTATDTVGTTLVACLTKIGVKKKKKKKKEKQK